MPAVNLWGFKPRNENQFLPPGEVAGVSGGDQGLGLVDLVLTPPPLPGLSIRLDDSVVPDVMNTAYVGLDYTRALASDLRLHLGGWYTDTTTIRR